MALLDNNVITESQPTEEDVTREALKAVQNVELMSHEEEDEGDSDADISIVEPKPLSLVEASEAVQDFAISRCHSTRQVQKKRNFCAPFLLWKILSYKWQQTTDTIFTKRIF